jgi:hypothetical protein
VFSADRKGSVLIEDINNSISMSELLFILLSCLKENDT